MANSKKLRKAAAKFRRTEPTTHALISKALDYMAYFINKSGAPEVTVKVCNGTIYDAYATDSKH